MAKNKFQWKCPQLSIAEAATQIEDCSVNDLVHAAAIGKLTLYALIDTLRPSEVSDIHRSKDIIDFSNYYTIKIPESENYFGWKDQHMVPAELDIDGSDFHPDVCIYENIIDYFRTEANSKLYVCVSGLLPLAMDTFQSYPNVDSSPIILNVSKHHILPDPDIERIVRLDPDIVVADAINAGKLFVMKEDLQRLSSNKSIDPEDAKPEGGVSRKTLLKLVIGMAMNQYKYDPDLKRTDVPKTIEIGLDLSRIKVSDDTIRKALQEAESIIPRKPA